MNKLVLQVEGKNLVIPLSFFKDSAMVQSFAQKINMNKEKRQSISKGFSYLGVVRFDLGDSASSKSTVGLTKH